MRYQWQRDWKIDFLEDMKDALRPAPRQPNEVKLQRERAALLEFILQHRRTE